MLKGPVSEVTEEALNVLSQELERALRDAPKRARPAITRNYGIRPTDFE